MNNNIKSSRQELELLFESESKDCKKFYGQGYVPKHYKRLTCTREEADELAKIGFLTIGKYFEENLFYTQAVIAGAVFSDKYDNIIVVTPSSYGKLIADDEPVLTRCGWKNHGDLVVGDEVIAPNGDFAKVTYVHPKGFANRVVTFADGSKVKCHENHLWAVNYRNVRTNEKSVKVRSTAEMEKAKVLYQSGKEAGRSKYTLIKRDAIKGEHKNLAVPPYVMGVWLGDGSTTKPQICACPDDVATLDKCREFYPNGGEWIHKDTGVITRHFIGLGQDLRKYDMCFLDDSSKRKRIPEEYLTASLEQRLELLAGLIDTDGYVDKERRDHARVVFTTSDVELKDSFEELISTFGWRVSTSVIPPTTSSSGIVGKKDVYVTSFSPDMTIPCVLPRKQFTEEQCAKRRCLGITAIEPIDPVQGNCITVEGGLYCVGKRMIPTHNSWLLGRIAVVMAYEGNPTYIAHANGEGTKIIMSHVVNCLQTAHDSVRNALLNKKDQLERLATSVSKAKVAFANGGFAESVTLGDTYVDNVSANKAVGKPGNYIIDEAALVSDQAFSELGRADVARIDGIKYKKIMISNPHHPGYFYDKLTQENPSKRTLIIWSDALTAVEEHRITKEVVFEGDFAQHRDTLRRYLLCVLPDDGEGMYTVPPLYKAPYKGDYVQHFLGVDAAYKGKDNIELCDTAVADGKIHIESIYEIKKDNWIEGKTSEDIIKEISRYARMTGAALVCVDVGWGVWLVEGLIRHGVPAVGVNFSESPTKERIRSKHYSATNASNKRAEMHLDFQDLTDGGVLEISEEVYSKIKDTLPYISSERKTSGKIQIKPKSELKAIIGHSPDEFDSVLLSLHAVVRFLGDSVYAIT